ncbi:MAG: choice-of-anchor L domain-containing protein, partial [Saprospiraceae bacterium]
MTRIFLFAAAFLFLSLSAEAQWLTVSGANTAPYNVPAQLIRDHLTGPGIEILNVEFDGAAGAVGYFTGGEQAIGLNRGLLLSTGSAASLGTSLGAEGTGTDFASTDNMISLVDPNLEALSTGPLHDMTRYRITFRASSDSIRFRYVFASEEYPEYACSAYNDVFGFFLQGPGYPVPVNIARVPGTNLSVSINNVHPANGTGCFAKNLQYYHSNLNSNQQPSYDGYLDVFVAEAAVQPCGIYTMTLAIADVSDGAYDSGVFLEAKSFESAAVVSASFDPANAILPENATADTVSLTFTNLPASLLPMTVKIGGTAQNGVDYQLIDSVSTIFTTDTILHWLVQPLADSLTEPFETVELTVRDTGCFYRQFTLYLTDPAPNFSPVDTIVLAAAQTVALTAPAPSALNAQSWAFSNNMTQVINPVMTMVYSELNVVSNSSGDPGAIPIATLNDPALLESVCINIEHAFVGDLDLYLFAPNGHFVELSTDNGDNGDNYTNTCFSPSATQSITFGMPIAPATAAPFTGTFQPEGDWNDLVGAPINGTWKLGVMDDANGFIGQLLNWSMTFSGAQLGDFHYLWSTGDTTKSLSVSEPGVYQVTVSNAVGAIKKTFIVHSDCSVYTPPVTASICAGGNYLFGGQILTTAGVYTDVLLLPNGCDSVLTLALTVLPASADSLLVTVQPGETFVYNGVTIAPGTTQLFFLQNASGCDS